MQLGQPRWIGRRHQWAKGPPDDEREEVRRADRQCQHAELQGGVTPFAFPLVARDEHVGALGA